MGYNCELNHPVLPWAGGGGGALLLSWFSSVKYIDKVNGLVIPDYIIFIFNDRDDE